MIHTIRFKMIIIFVSLLSITVISSLAINSIFLEDYYLSEREKEMLELYGKIDKFFNEENKDSDERMSYLDNLSEDYNVSLIVVDTSTTLAFSSGPRSNIMIGRVKDILFLGYDVETTEKAKDVKVIEKTDSYILSKMFNPLVDSEYIELYGVLTNENYYLLVWNPISNVSEIANISNTFYLLVSLSIIALSIVVIYFISGRFTRPINKLATISRKMADLDFDAKYIGKTKDEVSVLGNSLNYMSDKIKENISEIKSVNIQLQKDIVKKTEIDEMRKEFISNISHELKTPIALIQGYAEGLIESVNNDPESKNFYCEVIMDEAAKMNKMVQNLLMLNQIESGKSSLSFERFDIVEMIGQILRNYEIIIKQKAITVLFDSSKSFYVWTDEFRIQEVISNYITNALNHAENEKILKIVILKKNDNVRVEVSNTGSNIKEQDMLRLWDKFYKADKSRTREYGGNGIGLSIVKATMEALNKDYGVYNTKEGVTFWFEVDAKNS